MITRATATAILLLTLPAIAMAQHVNSDLWVTDGTVLATAIAGDTLYIGGGFSYVGPHTGGGVPLGTASGAALSGFPKVHGAVKAVASDGTGGWFIGGTFDSVGGMARANLAHIRSDLSVAPWAPNSNDNVLALAVSGSTVYAGGDFTFVGGQTRNYLAALDATTGLATSWIPNPNSSVVCLVVSGSTVYAGGGFSSIGGQTRNYVAALDATTGLATSWAPNPNNSVRTLAVSGSTVYAGGLFTTIGGQTRNYVAALDATTGLATSWAPNANSWVYALAVSGSTVYVGGTFSSIGGQTRNYIAALNATTGFATSWNPNANFYVQGLAVSGSTVYAGGQFTNIGGQARNRIAALDATTGLASSWDPNADNYVLAVAVSGSTVYAGGTFTSIGGRTRRNIAAFDVVTGRATSWAPNPIDLVFAVAVSGSTVYAGGTFTSIGGQTRFYIAALDAGTGLATSWNPSANSAVYALAVSGSTVYAGGNFGSIGGQTRLGIAALDVTTGLATSWNPNASSTVNALAVSGSKVYAGGQFTNIGGQTRNLIAALDSTTGLATSWNPNASPSGILALAVSGSTVYAGGKFGNIGGQVRPGVAALDAATGLATSWNPNANNHVYALAVSGSTVYAGGYFTSIGGQARNGIAAVDVATGLATSWISDTNISRGVLALTVSGATVYAGGDFTSMGGVPRQGIAAISGLLGISQLVPSQGGNGGALSVVVLGVGFQSGATVKLARSGQPDIVGSLVTVASDGGSVATTFDLGGKAQGDWDVTVTNPDASFASLPLGFTIESVQGPQLRVGLVGPALIRNNRRTAFDLVIENPGNVDALGVPVWITGVPLGATIELDFALSAPPRDAGEPDWATVPLGFTSPGGRYVPVIIPRVPPGTITRRVYLTLPSVVPPFPLGAALTPPWVDGNKFRGCLSAGGITGPACMGAQLTAINSYLASNPQLQALSGIGVWAKIAWGCEGAGTLAAALVKAEQILDFMVQPVEQPGSAIAACSDVLPPRWRDSFTVTIVGSIDPNDKLGLRDTLSVHQAIPYSIRFENLSSATAPAQQVVVSDPLDLATLNPGTVSLDVITFGNVHIVPPPGLRSYATQVDLRPGRNLLVNVSAAVDPFTGVLTWYFSSIDPATGQPPTDPLAGFLPPNNAQHEGEGSMLFTVMPRAQLASGTQISNGATITFDANAPLSTPAWFNTVDNAPPASHVLPLPANSDLPALAVNWTPDGASQDLRDYTVYVAEDGGPYRVWRLNTAATSDTLVPPGNHQFHHYAFYSVARDASGNIEALPAGPDAVTQSRTAVGDAGPWRLGLEGARPNPALGAMRVWFTLPSNEPATLEVVDIAGRRVMRREVGSFGPGPHSVALGESAVLRPGLYFLRLVQGSRVLSDRVAVIR